MTPQKQNIPALRFPEFKGEWQVKPIEDYIEEYNEKSKVQDEYEVLTSARSGLIRQKEYYEDNPITDRDNVGFNILPPNYVTYRSRSDDSLFFFNVNRLGITGIISIYYPVFRFKNGVNEFFTELFSVHKHFIGKHSVGTSQVVLSLPQLKKIRLPIPYMEEQKKIADFLMAVDQKIDQLTEKKSCLEQYKKGVMQRLFTQRLRFHDPNGNPFPDWEEMALGDVANVNMGQSPDSESYNTDKIGVPLIQGNADISNRITAPRNWTTEPTKMCDKGDIILSVRAPVGEVARSIHEACIGRGVCAIRNNKLSIQEFLYQWLLNYELEWRKLEQGSTFTAVSGADIRGVKISIPNKPEQQKIADFLTAIDAKITALGNQLTAAQDFKKSLLQKMFV
jgi:type I restriction enzyme S subunit